jgi:site-specific recombinase XerD
MFDEEYIARDPGRRVEKIKVEKRLKKAFTPVEIELMSHDPDRSFPSLTELTQSHGSLSIARVLALPFALVFCRFFKWLFDEEYIARDPGRRVEKIKVEKRLKKAFTPRRR